MSKSILYVVLCVVGAVAPMCFFVPWFGEHGVVLGPFIKALFANGPAGGFTVDLLISSFVFWIWMWDDSRKQGVRWIGLPIVANLSVGLSLGLPLYLWMRERQASKGA
ncbi:MAG: DUF2834 domain-containing protein [Deltaproteobacteria bacterium]|nr:MAG: DUF2834 domain-containing protein [Deltaproteobacteria bacterium]